MDDAPRSTAPEPADPAAAPDPADRRSSDDTEMWRTMLQGEDPGLPRLRRMWGLIPSAPRCKLCAAPFRGPGG